MIADSKSSISCLWFQGLGFEGLELIRAYIRGQEAADYLLRFFLRSSASSVDDMFVWRFLSLLVI